MINETPQRNSMANRHACSMEEVLQLKQEASEEDVVPYNIYGRKDKNYRPLPALITDKDPD